METLEGDEYSRFLHCSDSFEDTYLHQTYQIAHFKYMQFILRTLYLDKAVLKIHIQLSSCSSRGEISYQNLVSRVENMGEFSQLVRDQPHVSPDVSSLRKSQWKMSDTWFRALLDP